MRLLDVILEPDTRANQPAAGDVPIGTLYCVTDEDNLLERSNGTTWDQYAPTGGGGGGVGDFITFSQNQVSLNSGLASGGTYSVVGIGTDAAPTTAGTVAANPQALNPFTSFATAAAATATASVNLTSFALYQTRWLPVWEAIILAPDVLTTVRFWIGMSSAAFTDTDTQSPSKHVAAFRFSSVAGDTGWRGVTGDGSSQTVSANIGTVVAGTQYRLKIRVTSGHVFFSVDGGAETDQTTTLPTTTQNMGLDHKIITQANVVRIWSLNRSRIVFGTEVS